MAIVQLADVTFEQVRDLDKSRAVAIIPAGATEAHGPHLPLGTDVIIATAMAERGAELLEKRGFTSVICPALSYSVAAFAADFAGTVNLRPETARALLRDLILSLASHGFRYVAIANAHLDPKHIQCLRDAASDTSESVVTVFPDITRKPWALRLTDEFKSGACHAGCYEGSIVMAARPDLVRVDVQASLEPNPSSLSTAIRLGKSSFKEAGGPHAYFGYPADATAAEGHATIEALGQILSEAVVESFTKPRR